MLHEDLKTDVVCEDGGSFAAAPALVIVGLARIHLAQQEPRLTPALLSVDVPEIFRSQIGHRKDKTLDTK